MKIKKLSHLLFSSIAMFTIICLANVQLDAQIRVERSKPKPGGNTIFENCIDPNSTEINFFLKIEYGYEVEHIRFEINGNNFEYQDLDAQSIGYNSGIYWGLTLENWEGEMFNYTAVFNETLQELSDMYDGNIEQGFLNITIIIDYIHIDSEVNYISKNNVKYYTCPDSIEDGGEEEEGSIEGIGLIEVDNPSNQNSIFETNGQVDPLPEESFISSPIHRIKYRVYPNPSQDLINIEIPKEFDQITQVRMVDAKGNLIRSKSVKDELTNADLFISFNLQDLMTGTYFIVLDGPAGSKSTKIFKN